MPYETDKDVSKTIRFLERNRKSINFAFINKFILKDSRFKDESEKFNLSIGKKVNNILFNDKGRIKLLGGYHSTLREFNELKGLKWQKKKKEIDNSFERVRNFIYNDLMAEKGSLRYYHPAGNLPLLFYCYSELDTKKEVENVLYGN